MVIASRKKSGPQAPIFHYVYAAYQPQVFFFTYFEELLEEWRARRIAVTAAPTPTTAKPITNHHQPRPGAEEPEELPAFDVLDELFPEAAPVDSPAFV